MINSIENLEQLRKERSKLVMEMNDSKANLMNEVFQLELSLSPGRILVDVAKKIISPPNSFAGNMITNVVGNIASHTVFAGFGWPVKWLLTAASKNFAGNLITKNAPAIIQTLGNFIIKKKKDRKLLQMPETSFDR